MSFDKIKNKFVERFERELRNKLVDEPIVDMLKYINSLKDYFTTSSCAGRIVLMVIPENSKKFEAEFIYKTHYETFFDEVYRHLINAVNNTKDEIWFKMEPFILHISCRDLDSAYKIIKVAQNSGLKHSGIISIDDDRIVVEIMGIDKLETIVAKEGKILISEDYLKILVEIANRKLRKNTERREEFFRNLKIQQRQSQSHLQ